MSRDYLREMNDLLDGVVPEGDFVPAIVAAELVAKLRVTDRDLLAGWLDLLAERLVTDAVAAGLRETRRQARARAFSDAVGAHHGGDSAPLRHFETYFVVDEGFTRRAVADMTGSDHRFVAASYRVSSQQSAMLAAFHEAVAKKVGQRRTADVMDEATYDRLLRSLVRPERSKSNAA